MKIDDQAVTARLEEIRRQLGVGRADFVPRPFPDRVDKDLTTPKSVADLFHPSGILIHAGRPVFAYIRDHTVGEYPDDPAGRRKLHFTVCQTLEGMKRGGRFEGRYRLTNRDDNRYLVDVRGADGRGVELDGQALYPCKYCLANVSHRCYHTGLGDSAKNTIVRAFEAKEAFRLLWQQFDIFRQATTRLPSAVGPTGYSAHQGEISLAFRRSRNFICEQCRVRLNRNLVDTHHDDGDKRNNHYDNLRCLCKLCHAEKHPHYPVSGHVRTIIEKARREQGVSS